MTVRFTEAEYARLSESCSKTIVKELSTYIRSYLLDRKITTYVRDKSLDDFMEEMIRLRNELSAIGNNFNQVVRKLNSCQSAIEIKTLIPVSSALQHNLLLKIEIIKSCIAQLSEKWLQK